MNLSVNRCISGGFVGGFSSSRLNYEKRWVRVAKHCELEKRTSLNSDDVSLQSRERSSIKLAMFGSGLVGVANLVTLSSAKAADLKMVVLVHLGLKSRAQTRPIQQNVDNGVTGKRKRTTKKKPAAPIAKKARVTKKKEDTEYLEETRNLEDLWKVAFPIGIEWDKFDALYEFNWDFRNLEQALEEGGLLYGKKVFVFVTPEPQFVTYKDTSKVVNIPTVVAIESPFPPSDKLAEVSIQSAKEEIFPMKQMKMDWLPYIPFETRDRQVDRINFQIFILGCTQRRSAIRHLKEERARVFEFCLPYFYNPFAEDELEQSTVVDIVFPSEPPVVCDFDWEFNDLEEFVDKLIEEESLSAEQKDEFKEFVNEHVRAKKKAYREAKDVRKKAKEEISEDTKQAFQSIKFYKFYPQPSPDVPSFKTSPFINRYYRNAHQVL